ncbi:LamB/YcsF family protein [Conexibacter arvalis]|uniref:UPF0271 protein n=1 Tax=Conexibacter arvalis TaxID=912552 RepID=A0A840I763_9ACTN|nr:5-oxoprolinase subunit PxpA [Conexibacter arvalis]MBB4660697.1 UPF0271 protein [Conexibacter arvalis]
MAMRVDLNADAGESYGRWTLGDDARLLPLVTSINAACGFHAGDPATMRRTIRLAREHGLALGAHPAYPDLAGFGRRELRASATEIADLVTYQLGALAAFCAAEQVPLQHVKPHGALYVRVARDAEAADAVAAAIRAVDPTLALVYPAGDAADALERRSGIRVAREAYVDLDTGDDGIVVVEPSPRRRDPAEVAQRALDAVRGRIATVGGGAIETRVDTICIHGDAPGAVDNVNEIRRRFAAEDVEPRPLADVLR